MPRKHPTSWHFARPDLAARYLERFEIGLVSSIALYARRRMGKTQFLLEDLRPAAEGRGYSVGYCNLWQEDLDPLEALVSALQTAAMPATPIGRLHRKLSTPLSKLSIAGKAGLAEAGAEFSFREEKASPRLRQAFAVFDKARTKGLLLIDEAQVLADRKHSALEKAVRGLLDTRKDRLKVIFTGSSEDRLRSMFGLENKAFYNWASVEPLPLLGAEFAIELTTRANQLTRLPLKEREALRAFEELHRVPELFRRFMSQYLAQPFEGTDAALAFCKRSIYDDADFERRWRRLKPADAVLLRLVAEARVPLHGIEARKELARVLGLRELPPMSVPQNSLRRMRQQQILIQSANGLYRFEDDSFRDFVLSHSRSGQAG